MEEQPAGGVVCPRGGPAHRVQKLETVPVPTDSALACPFYIPLFIAGLCLFFAAPGIGVLVTGADLVLGLLGVLWFLLMTGSAVGIYIWRNRGRRAVAKWHRLWYCFDDDCVFLAGQTELIPSARVPKFLYEP